MSVAGTSELFYKLGVQDRLAGRQRRVVGSDEGEHRLRFATAVLLRNATTDYWLMCYNAGYAGLDKPDDQP